MKRTLIFLKGNPKYWIPGVSEKFQDRIKFIFKDFDIIELESDISSTQIPKTKPGDVILGHSRGCGYWKWLRLRHEPATLVGVGCGNDPIQPDIKLQNPRDDGSKNFDAMVAHWTLTPEMEQKLIQIAKGHG
jgi:hypothetical protein